MLGVRLFACAGCETVYADVAEPPRCRDCDGTAINEIGPGTQAAEYFTPSRTRQC